MNPTWRSVLAGAVVAASSLLGAGPAGAAQATQPASAPATQAATRPAVVLPLSRVPRGPVGRYTLKQLEEMFPAFQHEPFETAGFNHLALPFHYEDRSGGSGDANEANAFAFLISSALDWGEGGYCARHAYFVFKRSDKAMKALARQYDAERVRFCVNDWQASHAVGGKLVRQKDGYSGSLVVYDRTARPVLEASYDKPREFFDLLGDMSVDAIKAMTKAPSPELVKHLHVPQCKDRQSLVDLGKAAFMEERSKEEFALYDAILKRDPDFAAVRYWRANQKWWQDRDHAAKALEYAKALNAHLALGALEDFSPEQCRDKTVAGLYPAWTEQARQLGGDSQLWVVTRELRAARNERRLTSELVEQATRAAAKYPNEYPLLYSLSTAYTRSDSFGDFDMGTSILVAALRNRYMPGAGGKPEAILPLAEGAHYLGHNDACVQLLLAQVGPPDQRADPSTIYNEAWFLGAAMFEMGRFDESCDWYRLAFQGIPDRSPWKIQALVGEAVAGAHAGRTDVVGQILRDHRDLLDKAHVSGLVQTYLDLLAGKAMTYNDVWSRPDPGEYWLDDRLQTITIEADLLAGRPAHAAWAEDYLRLEWHRRTWKVLLHQTFQQHPRLASDCFYEAIEWLDGDDPWVRQAVAAYRAGGAKGEVVPLAKIQAALKDYPPVRWAKPDAIDTPRAWKVLTSLRAGAVPVAVRDLIRAARFDQAEELALRYLNLCTISGYYWARVHAYHLVHLVQQERKAMKGAVGPDDL
jgi:hypothetical protein